MTQLTRRTPNRTVRDLQREVDSLFDRFFGRGSDEDTSALWAPSTDLTETDDAFEIQMDVPGMSKEDININLQNNTLTVSGERAREETRDDEDRVRVERVFGSFHRTFTLPDAVDHEDIEAAYDDGVLRISVPKTEESTRRQIEIQ
ncbi:MAG: Hsp20/alpha crystallin family protein [Salinivenus sp.]